MKPHLVFVVGPTACGKSDLALEVAENFGQPAEIVNSDSIQFFEGLEIGSAKPDASALAKVPHHLIGHKPKGSVFTAGDFRRDALEIIERRFKDGVTRFLVVGGSGFYVQALEKGMYDVPASPENLRQDLEAQADREGLHVLHQELNLRDPVAGIRIKPQDRYRIIRALEILRPDAKQRSLSEIQAEFERARPEAPFSVSKIGVRRDRGILRSAVESRTRRMLAAGFIDEVRSLRGEGLGNWAPLKSVGYQEVQDLLDGKLTEAELVPAIVTSTMQLAKRQMTWFKRDHAIEWFDADRDWQKAKEILSRRLAQT